MQASQEKAVRGLDEPRLLGGLQQLREVAVVLHQRGGVREEHGAGCEQVPPRPAVCVQEHDGLSRARPSAHQEVVPGRDGVQRGLLLGGQAHEAALVVAPRARVHGEPVQVLHVQVQVAELHQLIGQGLLLLVEVVQLLSQRVHPLRLALRPRPLPRKLGCPLLQVGIKLPGPHRRVPGIRRLLEQLLVLPLRHEQVELEPGKLLAPLQGGDFLFPDLQGLGKGCKEGMGNAAGPAESKEVERCGHGLFLAQLLEAVADLVRGGVLLGNADDGLDVRLGHPALCLQEVLEVPQKRGEADAVFVAREHVADEALYKGVKCQKEEAFVGAQHAGEARHASVQGVSGHGFLVGSDCHSPPSPPMLSLENRPQTGCVGFRHNKLASFKTQGGGFGSVIVP